MVDFNCNAISFFSSISVDFISLVGEKILHKTHLKFFYDHFLFSLAPTYGHQFTAGGGPSPPGPRLFRELTFTLSLWTSFSRWRCCLLVRIDIKMLSSKTIKIMPIMAWLLASAAWSPPRGAPSKGHSLPLQYCLVYRRRKLARLRPSSELVRHSQ